jgi:hypothetical protein
LAFCLALFIALFIDFLLGVLLADDGQDWSGVPVAARFLFELTSLLSTIVTIGAPLGLGSVNVRGASSGKRLLLV